MIDVHAHALPMPLLRDLAASGHADLAALPEGAITLDPRLSGLVGWSRIPVAPQQYDVAARLVAMDATGVDAQLVSAPPFVFGSMCEDPGLVMDVTRRVNDALAEFVATAPDRLFALATVPIGHPEATAELVRCLDRLGFAGAAIGSFGGGVELDDPRNEELWGSCRHAAASPCCIRAGPRPPSGWRRTTWFSCWATRWRPRWPLPG
ncbi:amidohydrolase family protein [Nonomuraea antimicrobica]